MDWIHMEIMLQMDHNPGKCLSKQSGHNARSAGLVRRGAGIGTQELIECKSRPGYHRLRGYFDRCTPIEISSLTPPITHVFLLR